MPMRSPERLPQSLPPRREHAVAARGRFIIAVSGGHTPWLMLRALADENVPWEGVHIVQVDERVAPAGDPDRNLTHLRESLLDACPLAPRADPCHAGGSARPGSRAAQDYARTLAEIAGSPPVLDLVHLGLGPDGHTASLVPGDPVLNVTDSRCRADRRLPGQAPDDIDLSDYQSFPAHPLGGDRK